MRSAPSELGAAGIFVSETVLARVLPAHHIAHPAQPLASGAFVASRIPGFVVLAWPRAALCWNLASGNVLLVLLWWGQGPTELSSLLLVLVLQSPCVGHTGSVKPSNRVLPASLSILCGIYPSKRLRAGSTRHHGGVSSGLLSAPGCSPAQLFS